MVLFDGLFNCKFFIKEIKREYSLFKSKLINKRLKYILESVLEKKI